VTVPGALAVGGVCNGWLVTARGNRVPLELKKVESITVAEVAAGIGAISMNFTNFYYYNVSENGGSYVLENYPNGASGYAVNQPSSKDDGVAFQISITNYDLESRPITLYSSSLLWTLFPNTVQQPRGAMWSIVNVDNNGIIANNFTPITLAPNTPTLLYFASEQDVSGGFSPSSSNYGGLAPVNLALFGQIAGSPYGQNLPFVSIYITVN
jgi:hypothetical protein